MQGRVLDCLRIFILIVEFYESLSHNWRRKSLYTLHSPAMKWFLNVWISLSELFALWILVWTNWYLMFMEVIVIFKYVYASLSMKWKPGLIPRLLKSSVNSVKAFIIYLSLLFFIALVRMALQSQTYIT